MNAPPATVNVPPTVAEPTPDTVSVDTVVDPVLIVLGVMLVPFTAVAILVNREPSPVKEAAVTDPFSSTMNWLLEPTVIVPTTCSAFDGVLVPIPI